MKRNQFLGHYLNRQKIKAVKSKRKEYEIGFFD